MAKTDVAVAEKTASISDRAKQAAGLPQPSASASPPAHLAEYAERDAGQGVSTSMDDNLVPLVYVLIMAAVVVNMFVTEEQRAEALVGAGFIAAGALIYLALFRKGRTGP